MTLDDLLNQTSSVPGPEDRVLTAARARLDTAVRNAPVSLASPRYSRRQRTSLALTAAAAAVAAVVVPAVSLGNQAPSARASAATVLREAAQAAGNQPGSWANASYWHSVSLYRRGGDRPVRREIWIGNDRPGVLKDPGVDCTGVIPLTEGLFTGERVAGWAGLYELPTDPAALEAALRRGRGRGEGNDADSELYSRVGDLLSESPAPPALRRALYEVAANVPGVELLGPLKDLDGRPGVGIQREGDRRLIIDATDGRLLQSTDRNFTATFREQGPAETAPTATISNDTVHRPCA